MKVAVLVIGELRNSEFVKNLYDGCDVFVHTDKKYGEPFPAKYQYFDENQKRFVDKLIDRKFENFHRIGTVVLCTFSDFKICRFCPF